MLKVINDICNTSIERTSLTQGAITRIPGSEAIYGSSFPKSIVSEMKPGTVSTFTSYCWHRCSTWVAWMGSLTALAQCKLGT